jgi:hypothetical protein
MHHISVRSNQAMDRFAPVALKTISTLMHVGQRCHVYSSSRVIFMMTTDSGRQYRVNLLDRTCSSRMRQEHSIPFHHANAAILSNKDDIYSYISAIWTADCCITAYSFSRDPNRNRRSTFWSSFASIHPMTHRETQKQETLILRKFKSKKVW